MASLKGLYYCCYYNTEEPPIIYAYNTVGEALANFLCELSSFADKPLTYEEVLEARREGFYQKEDKNFVAYGRFGENGPLDNLERRLDKNARKG